jgi:poly(3-hydroxybutyrate) depolymerase
MKRLSLLIYLMFLSSGLYLTANAQQVFKTTKPSVIGYLEYLPRDYHNSSKDYPVVIFLHGRDEKGANSKDPSELSKTIDRVTKLGPPHYVKKGTQFPFILISPQLKYGHGNWPLSYIMEVVDHVKKSLRVDEQRIYLTGLSLGGGGVWTAAENHPDVFAAVAPVCGSWNTISKAKRIADQDIPVWAFHGDRDNVVPWSRSKKMVDEINKYKPNPRAKFTTYKGVMHNAWDKAYKPDHSVHSPNVYEWLMSHVNHRTSQQQQQQEDPQIRNKPPLVNAGANRSGTTDDQRVELAGRASDSDGKVVKYSWLKVSGPGVHMSGAATSRLVISDFSSGTYQFRFTVTDNKGASKSDDVRVVIHPSSKPGLIAHAGPDRYLTLPVTYYTMAAGATSRGGTIASYEWRQVDGPPLGLANTNARIMRISNVTKPGRRTFVLTVRDSKGRIARDHVRVYFESPTARGGN